MGQRAHPRLELEPAVTRRVGPEEDAVAVEEANLTRGIVRKDVASLVVGGCHGDAAQTRAAGRVVQNARHALVREVAGEGEYRRLDGQDVSAAAFAQRAALGTD